MKERWVLLLLGTLLCLCGCRSTSASSDGTLFVSGRIDGDTLDLSSKRPGRVVEIRVREGDAVQEGQLLAVLASDQDDARRDQQMARIVADQRTMSKLQRELKTYQERIRQAQIYQEQSQVQAPAQVQEAEANLASSKADLVRSEAELRQTQINAERYAPLVKKGAISAQIAEQYATSQSVAEATVEANRKKVAASEASLLSAQSQLENPRIKEADRITLEREVDEVKEQIAAAQADVEAARAELRRIEADLNDLKIVAPIAGTILTRSAEPGRVIASGQTILTMVDLTKLYLRGFVPEGNVGDVKVGQSAEVYLDSRPKQPIPAEVIRIDPQVMFTPENTYFQDDRVKQVMGVKLGLRGAYGLAKPGMPADGTIQIGGRSDGRE